MSGGVAYVLHTWARFAGAEIPVAFRAPVRSFLEKEIATPTFVESSRDRPKDSWGLLPGGDGNGEGEGDGNL